MLNKKHNLKSGKQNKDKKKKDLKGKTIDEKIAIKCSDVVPFMKQKQRRN